MLTSKQTPRVVFQPDVHRALQRGIHKIVSALRPTLGPLARNVAIDHVNEAEMLPEVLDDGGVIARRIIELPDRGEDMGAMLVRSMIVEQHEKVGDGTAACAVLFEAIFNAGVRYTAAGGNTMQLRRHIESLLPSILGKLDNMAESLAGRQALTNMAYSLCHDREMADLLGEAFDLIGEYGRLEIREGYGRGMHLEFVEGTYYETGLISRTILPDDTVTRIELETPAVFLCDFSIEDHRELYPVLQMAFQAGIKELIIVVRNLSEKGVSLLATNNKMDKITAIAVKIPGLNETDRLAALDDLAILTGAKPMLQATGDSLENVTPEHYGHVRRAWADLRAFGIVGGKGAPQQIREHIHKLKRVYLNGTDQTKRDSALKRVGTLLGGSVTLWVGGYTEPEITTRKSLAVRTARTIRAAAAEGIVPGGGVSLLKISRQLDSERGTYESTDERAARHILSEALAAPARTIYHNAGYDPGEVMAKLSFEDENAGFDVLTGTVANVRQVGIWDSHSVLKNAVANAVRTAALTLTIDSLVHMRNVEMVKYPDGTSD